MGGESASCVSDRAYYGPTNATDGHVNADDVGCVIEAWQSAGTRPWVIGNFAWASAVNKTAMTPTANLLTPLPPPGRQSQTGTDYKGEPSPLNWQVVAQDQTCPLPRTPLHY